MADFSLGTQVFPPGTSVAAYAETDWLPHQRPPSGSPPGTAVDSGTVGATGLTLTGLTDGASYWVHGEVASEDRYVRITVGGPTGDYAISDVTGLQTALDAKATEADRTASGLAVVEHGATAGTARPSGYAAVVWLGTVEPTNGADGDLWVDTT